MLNLSNPVSYKATTQYWRSKNSLSMMMKKDKKIWTRWRPVTFSDVINRMDLELPFSANCSNIHVYTDSCTLPRSAQIPWPHCQTKKKKKKKTWSLPHKHVATWLSTKPKVSSKFVHLIWPYLWFIPWTMYIFYFAGKLESLKYIYTFT